MTTVVFDILFVVYFTVRFPCDDRNNDDQANILIHLSLLFFCSPQAWALLEKAEHSRELALHNELIRQERLDHLASCFNRKATIRETWLSDNQKLVSQV